MYYQSNTHFSMPRYLLIFSYTAISSNSNGVLSAQCHCHNEAEHPQRHQHPQHDDGVRLELEWVSWVSEWADTSSQPLLEITALCPGKPVTWVLRWSAGLQRTMITAIILSPPAMDQWQTPWPKTRAQHRRGRLPRLLLLLPAFQQ